MGEERFQGLKLPKLSQELKILRVRGKKILHLPEKEYDQKLRTLKLEDGLYFYLPEKIKNINILNAKLNEEPVAGLKLFLRDKKFKGIGEALSEKLANKYGLKILRYLHEGDFSGISGKGSERIIKALKDGWSELKESAVLEIFLNQISLSQRQKDFVKDFYGNAFIENLFVNPYQSLKYIPRFQFSEIQNLVKTLDICVLDEQVVIEVALNELERSESGFGNTCAPFARLKDSILQKTTMDLETVEENLLRTCDELKKTEKSDKIYIESSQAFERDKKIRSEFERLVDTFPEKFKKIKNVKKDELILSKGIVFSYDQLEAINKSISSPISVITGGPGSGKTTLMRELVQILQSLKRKIKICAPTGRAAKRISEIPSLKAFRPSTIHSFLYFNEQSESKKKIDTIIVDESSMIDIDLLEELLGVVPDGAQIIFVGDADQLPPVGPGQPFRDFIKSDVIPISRLIGNFRQDMDSDIVFAAQNIIKGKLPAINYDLAETDFNFVEAEVGEEVTKILDIYYQILPKMLKPPEVGEIQILSPMHSRGPGISILNSIIQEREIRRTNVLFTKDGKDGEVNFYVGDKVIMTKNQKELGVMNGDVGYITGRADKDLLVCFDKDIRITYKDCFRLDLAYAISIHKSQGSEYPAVIVPVSLEHKFMLSRNLIYTAITRGKSKVFFVGQRRVLRDALSNTSKDLRHTNLAYQLSLSAINFFENLQH